MSLKFFFKVLLFVVTQCAAQDNSTIDFETGTTWISPAAVDNHGADI